MLVNGLYDLTTHLDPDLEGLDLHRLAVRVLCEVADRHRLPMPELAD